jgi:hypothetical protein
MVLVECFDIEAIRCGALQPKPIAGFGKILIGKYSCLKGILRSTHELVGSVVFRHDEIFHHIGFTLRTREHLCKHALSEEG